MQRVLIGIGLLAAAVLIAASATMNYVFMTSIARTPFEGHLLGAVSVAVDVMKALLAVFVAAAARDDRRTFVIIGSGAFLLFTAASMMAAAGFASLNRSAVVDRHDIRQQAFADLQRELSGTERKLAALPQHRPVPVIEEDINALRFDVRWSASKSCLAPSSGQQRELCTALARLRSEGAAASEADRLEALAGRLREQIAKLRDDGGSAGADPQARLLAQTFGLNEGNARRLLMALLALVVEVASGLGVYLATGHAARAKERPVQDAGVSHRHGAEPIAEPGATAAEHDTGNRDILVQPHARMQQPETEEVPAEWTDEASTRPARQAKVALRPRRAPYQVPSKTPVKTG